MDTLHNTPLIRKAGPEDAAAVAFYAMLAMNDIIYRFIGEKSPEKAQNFLEALVREKGNQYSYENCWVVISEAETVAAAIVYDGSDLHTLRAPVIHAVKDRFNRDFRPEDETQAGEFYIDCLGVAPRRQGKGIGTLLLRFLQETYVHGQGKAIGLLVDKDNPKAKQLYLKLGFEVVGEKSLAGKEMEHLQYKTKA